MALTLIGGSVLSSFLNVLFDRAASPEVLDFFKGRKLDQSLIGRLKTAMISVNGLLDDAEEKQVTKGPVKEWLDELKDAFYEADDLLDAIAYEAKRSKLEAVESQTHSITTQVWNFFSSGDSFRKEMVANLRNIVDRLECLVNQKEVLGLIVGIGETPLSHKIPTTSIADEHGFYGRDAEKNILIELLLSDDANGNELDVIPIVGMGGIGKTTLAQQVYNDSRVQDWFDLKAWVCVPEDFNVFNITKDIFEEVASKTSEASTLNKLHDKLKTTLKEKKFLLILDDVWNDKYESWDSLRKPLKAGARGSKIVVTTRNQHVADLMGTVPCHQLKELKDEDCWFLFTKHAFSEKNNSSRADLEECGKNIVRKCKGLPLAAKALAGLLRTKGGAKEWKKVLESSIWDLPNDNILPALRLSYHYLPSHLKRCFAYCAIFPKDYHIRKEKLICLWMAEGFLDQPKGKKDMTELGEEYFHDLMSRSFFQKSNRISSHFIMHDLTNDLAKFVSGVFFVRLEDDNDSKITEKARHLSYLRSSSDSMTRFKAIYGAKKLRAFLPVSLFRYWVRVSEGIDSKLVHDLLPVLVQLRVLSLSHYDNLTEIPDSIGKLRHLRYLSFSGTPIKRLPESVTTLFYLQTLNLKRCRKLIALPTDMAKLINLCYLNIIETNLKEMPLHMGNLSELRKLTDFVLGDQSGSSIKELGSLQNLKGRFGLWNLENVKGERDALQANLRDKKNLEELQLRWFGDTNDSLHDKDVLEQLQPHRNIESVVIIGYGGTTFSNWVGDSSFSNLATLKLSGCKYCSSLPPLGQLRSLKVLLIKEFAAVEDVNDGFCGNCIGMMEPFASLEILRFEKMLEWKKWTHSGLEAFPLLQKLTIKQCPNLVNALPCNLPSLTTLEIEGCQLLEAPLPRAPSVLSINLTDQSRHLLFGKTSCGLYRITAERFLSHPIDSLFEQMGGLSTTIDEIKIKDCCTLNCLPLNLFSGIKMLDITNCASLDSLSASGGPLEIFTSLSSLVISNCFSLLSFPIGGLSAPNLTKLEFQNCPRLRSLPDQMHSFLPSLVELRLSHCAELVSFPKGGLPMNLQSLEVHQCNKLFVGRSGWGLQGLPSLSEFLIGTIEDVQSFPEKGLLPSTLTCLKISSYMNLMSLDHNGLEHLTSLRELTLMNCRNLTELPASMHLLLPYLEKLVFFNCQELGSFPTAGLPPKLCSIVIQDCRKLITGRLQWGLQRLQSLLNLTIGKDKVVESFPEETLLPSSLTSLKVKEFKNLKSLNYRGLQHLSCLRELKIQRCSKIESLPVQGLPSSVTSLIISGCSMLTTRCQRNGEDWQKISRIPSIVIDNVFINEINE